MTEEKRLMPEEWKAPFKQNRYLIKSSGIPGRWDQSVDCPFVFSYDGGYRMIFLGYDGTGYQTAMACSRDLVNWETDGIILKRNPEDPSIKYNAAMNWILRENDFFSEGDLKPVDGRFLGVYHAYPGVGYESGPAAIGLCWSGDLRKWEIEPPFLKAEEGADWERGGLYKPCLIEHEGVYYLFYNAKTVGSEGEVWEKHPWLNWHEQIGMAYSKDLKNWVRYEGSPLIRNGCRGSCDERVIGDPSVYRFRNQWIMYYYCFNEAGESRNYVAVSDDLFHWEKCAGCVVECGSGEDVDADVAFKPYTVYHDGVLYLYYTAANDRRGGHGITLTTSKPL